MKKIDYSAMTNTIKQSAARRREEIQRGSTNKQKGSKRGSWGEPENYGESMIYILGEEKWDKGRFRHCDVRKFDSRGKGGG